MKPTHEIYDGWEKIGTAIALEGGDISITIKGNFVGIFKSFESWNIGNQYFIKQLETEDVDTLADLSKKIEVDELLEDPDFYGWYPPVGIGNTKVDNYSLDLDLDEDEDLTMFGQKTLRLKESIMDRINARAFLLYRRRYKTNED